MTDFLKGNYKINENFEVKEGVATENNSDKEFREKAINSIGGSMVFVERQVLDWDDETDTIDGNDK